MAQVLRQGDQVNIYPFIEAEKMCQTGIAGRAAIVEYIGWYNGTRLHSTLGYLSPA